MTNNAGSIANVRKKTYKIHECISTSYHEAGHAVYGLLHCMKINSVSIFEDKKSKRIEGFTQYDDEPKIETIEDPVLLHDRLHAEIGLSYAGLAAEKRYFKIISGSDNFPLFLREGSAPDISEAAALFQKYNIALPGRKRYEYKKKFFRKVDKELQLHWDAVTVIAHNLFKKKKIYFSELKDLLTRKTKNKEFWKNQFKTIHDFSDNGKSLDEKDMKYILSL